MSLARTIGRNVCFNWLDNGVRIVVTFFLTPYIFHALGDARFGLWTLIIGVVGYYGLINLGFQSSLNQYIARYAALKDYSALQRLVSTAWFLLAGCASILLAATPVVAWLTPYIFDIPADMTNETRWCLLIVGATTAISFLFFPFSSVLPALQRFDLSSSIGLVGRLVFAGADHSGTKNKRHTRSGQPSHRVSRGDRLQRAFLCRAANPSPVEDLTSPRKPQELVRISALWLLECRFLNGSLVCPHSPDR